MKKDILAIAAQRLADYKVPERLVVVDRLPLNALGKLNQKALAGMARQQGGTAHATNPSLTSAR